MTRTLQACMLTCSTILPLALLAIGGCAMVPLPHETIVVEPDGLVIRNTTRDTLEVEVYIGQGVTSGPGVGDVRRGPLVTVRRGTEVAYPGPIPAADVVRIRVTRVVPSWEETEPIWWEVVGPLPITIQVAEGPDGRVYFDGDGRIAMVPRRLWLEDSP